MINLCIALLVLGIAGLLVEMFIPGFGFFGIAGVLMLLAAAVVAVAYVPYGWFIVAAEAVVLGGFLYFIFGYIRKKQLRGRLIMDETLDEDYPLPGDFSDWVGKEGMALTPLRPFGEADFNGARREVSSEGSFIGKGQRIRVVATEKSKIIVRRVSN